MGRTLYIKTSARCCSMTDAGTEQVGMRRMVVGRIGPCDLKIAL